MNCIVGRPKVVLLAIHGVADLLYASGGLVSGVSCKLGLHAGLGLAGTALSTPHAIVQPSQRNT